MRPLALTIGEPAGIGPELSLQLWAARNKNGVPPFLLLGDPALLAARAKAIGLDVKIVESNAAEAAREFPRALPVFPLGIASQAKPGQPDGASAALARAAIERAVALVQDGRCSSVVTNPISKAVMTAAGFGFPGHTEFLAHLAARGGIAPRPVMMIWSEELAVIPVTIHVPLAEVPHLLSIELIAETGRIAARDLRARFGNLSPRLAVCGLNPHAGEAGTIGREDEMVVRPAVEKLKAEGIDASGPFPADTLFHADARSKYDVALGMYHDQVLAPVKTLAFDRAVNVTLGLPFVRTSPDHGTAFDLAGTGRANPASLLAALKLAQRISAAAPAPAG
jgi:4-hydroxythreonine-4-phosphate dehydrogenase